MEYLAITIITLLSGVIGTGLGGIVGAILRRESNKIISLLLSFAGGIMLAVVCFDLMNRPIAMMRKGFFPPYTPILVVVAVVLGYSIIYFLNFLIDKRLGGRTSRSDKKNNAFELLTTGLIMIIAIALHNFPEGMVIGASYALEPDLLSNLFTGSGFIMAIVIGLHNIPEGMAVSVPLISGGIGKTKAVFLTALCGLPTVLGALLGFALGGINDIMLTLSLGFASGAMLFVVFGELLPESILMWKSKLPAFSLFIGLLVGFLLVIF